MAATLHFILADFGPKIGTAWVERDPNRMDRETTIRDLIAGQIDRPLRVLEVIPDENSSNDVSEDIARDIAGRVQRDPISDALIGFIWDHAGSALAREMVAA